MRTVVKLLSGYSVLTAAAMRWARVVTPGLLATTLMGATCDFIEPGFSMTVSVPGQTAFPLWFEVGDTVQYVAVEHSTDNGAVSPSSAASPADYGWHSTDSSVAEVIAPGRVRMLKSGAATILVRSLHVRREVMVLVAPAVAEFDLTPDSTSIAVGETATLKVEIPDAHGAEIEALHQNTVLDVRQANPALGIGYLTRPAHSAEWMLRGVKPGTTLVVARLNLYRRAITDTTTVVVR